MILITPAIYSYTFITNYMIIAITDIELLYFFLTNIAICLLYLAKLFINGFLIK